MCSLMGDMTLAQRKTSVAEDLLDLVALLPWWVGVTLAGVSYLVLHRLAVPVVMTTVQPGQMGAIVVRSMGTALALAGQYVVPVICLGGAGLSAWRRRQRRQLTETVVQGKGADVLDGMSWRDFEMLVGEAFRLQGYSVVETGGGGADGGVDLVLTKAGEKFLVQCKQWKAFRVGVDVVRELYGVMAAKGAAGGFVVTSGSFTKEAKAFADGRNVRLVDGHRLLGLIKQARAAISSDGGRPIQEIRPAGTAPSCPVCAAGMVRRTAKKGASAGSSFWGCSNYPSCRGTRPIG